MAYRNSFTVLLGSAVAFVLLNAGCATKKFVRNQVDPLQTHLGQVEKKTDDNAKQIDAVGEKADQGIAEAKSAADQANQAATKADQHAQTAQNEAEQAGTRVDAVQQQVENVDNFQAAKSETVLFKFNQAKLTDDDKAKLDELAQSVQSMKHYVIQIQGFTDKTGPATYNLELSQRRADAVVRYLTENHKVPLVRIYRLGLGEDSPAAPNNTRDGRAQNRRVEVQVMTPPSTTTQAEAAKPAAAATTTPQPQK